MEIAPMLATAAEPFDSPEHLFEIKWDGIRALVAVEEGGWRLWGRGAAGYADRYPELQALRDLLPEGTVLDGELVRLTPQGRADFSAVLRRHQLASPRKIHWAAQREPVAYMGFDLLQLRGECLLKEPLSVRRDLLEQLVGLIDGSPLRLSPAVTNFGTALFDDAAAQGHEGIMAKRLDSRYQPGRRSPAWRKIKPREVTLCVIFGYRVGRGSSLTTLLLAAHHGGALRYAGEVRCRRLRDTARLAEQLKELPSERPLVLCDKKARWVRPQLYCQVRHFGWTVHSRLRFPLLVRLVETD